MDTPDTRTGAPAEPAWRAAYSIDVSTMAAPPSDVAQISSRCNGSATIGEARTSSTVTSFWNRALGLAKPLAAFLTLTLAKSVLVAP